MALASTSACAKVALEGFHGLQTTAAAPTLPQVHGDPAPSNPAPPQGKAGGSKGTCLGVLGLIPATVGSESSMVLVYLLGHQAGLWTVWGTWERELGITRAGSREHGALRRYCLNPVPPSIEVQRSIAPLF